MTILQRKISLYLSTSCILVFHVSVSQRQINRRRADIESSCKLNPAFREHLDQRGGEFPLSQNY